ncbi:uncharacterized protein LOC113458737 [Zonotrichia albicollis]|uniref:uncharacterized protein LOC113458737 n=1 Tax=Zonotrichia albicollis TaxID=44394 RepID=UPI003D810403
MCSLKCSIQKTFISVTYCLISLHVHQSLLFSSLSHQKGCLFPKTRLNGEGGARSLGAVATGASAASASLRARPSSSAPHRALAQAEGFGEWLLALGRDPHPLSVLRHPLNEIPQLSATLLRTSNPPGNLEKKNKGAKNKEPGRGRKGRGGEGREGKGELPPFGSGRDPPLRPRRVSAARPHGAPAVQSGAGHGWPWEPHPGSEAPTGPAGACSGSAWCPAALPRSCRALSDETAGGGCPGSPAHGRARPAAQRCPSEVPRRAPSAASPAGSPVPGRATCPPHSSAGRLEGLWGQLENSERGAEAKQRSRFPAGIPLPSQQR